MEDIKLQLKNKGYKKSVLREILLHNFFKLEIPISAQDIIDFLEQKNIKAHKTTIYRELDLLLKENIIIEIDLLEGKKRYELHKDHHHHAVCESCNNIECIDVNEEAEKLLFKDSRFKVKAHVLEVFGICSKCQKN